MAQIEKRLYDGTRDRLDYVSTKLSNAVHDFNHEGQKNTLLGVLDAESADEADEKLSRLDLLVASGCAKTKADWDLIKWANGIWGEYKIARA